MSTKTTATECNAIEERAARCPMQDVGWWRGGGCAILDDPRGTGHVCALWHLVMKGLSIYIVMRLVLLKERGRKGVVPSPGWSHRAVRLPGRCLSSSSVCVPIHTHHCSSLLMSTIFQGGPLFWERWITLWRVSSKKVLPHRQLTRWLQTLTLPLKALNANCQFYMQSSAKHTGDCTAGAHSFTTRRKRKLLGASFSALSVARRCSKWLCEHRFYHFGDKWWR